MCHYPAVFVAKYLHIHSSVSDCICLYFLDKYIYIHADPAGRDARVFIPNQRGPQACSSPEASGSGAAADSSAAACSRPIVVVVAHHAIEQISLLLLHLIAILFDTRFR